VFFGPQEIKQAATTGSAKNRRTFIAWRYDEFKDKLAKYFQNLKANC